MDAAQLNKRSVLFLAAGLLVATTGRAADLVVSISNVVITGRVLSQTVQVASASATPFTISTTYADAGIVPWLRVSADNSNTTPSNLTVALASSPLGNGPFNATVTLTPSSGGGAAATINVQYQPGSTVPPSTLTVTPSPSNPAYTLTLTYTTNGTLPQQTVSVSGATSYSASLTSDTSSSMQLTPVGQIQGSQLLTVQLMSTAATLATGTYFGTVVINATSGQATINVTINVNGGSAGNLVVSPGSLTFSYQTGGLVTSIPPETLVTTSPAGATFTATATSDAGWLFLGTPSLGNIPGYLQVYAVVPQAGLAAGSYSGTITITSGSLSQTITVQFLISGNPVLVPTVSGTGAGTVLFNVQNGVVTPSSQMVALLASDHSAVTGLALASVPSFATVDLTGTNLTITPIAGLTGAVYSGSVVVVSNLANGQIAIPVIVVGSTGGTTGLTLSQSSFVFQALVNGPAPSSQTLNVTASGSTPFTATSSSNAPWLSISPSGSLLTPQTLTVSVNPAAAGSVAGTLAGSISLTANGVTQTLSVTLQLSNSTGGGNVTTDQSSLSFTVQAGSAAPTPKTLVVSNAVTGTAGILYSVSTSTSWLSATPSQATTQSVVSVSVNPAGLAAGTYTGNVTITPTGGTAVSIPVTFTVQPAATVTASPTSLTFTYRVGGDAPAAQTVQTSGGTFTTQASSDGNWLSVSPATGSTGSSITASVNPAGLNAGTRSGTITVTGAQGVAGTVVISVTLSITAPLPTITQVVNGASFLATGSVAPGEFITLSGTALGPTTPLTAQVDSLGKIATLLGGVQVLVNGFAAPLIYASGTQVSAVVPYEMTRYLGTSVPVLLRYLGQGSNGVSVSVAATNPGIFTQNSAGTGPGAFNADFSLNGPNNPVSKSGTVTFFLTGEGQTNPPGVTGTVNSATENAPSPVANISVSIDGQAATYAYAAGVPGAVEGVMQLNVQIPATARSGDLPVVVFIGGTPSQPGVTVSVQ